MGKALIVVDVQNDFCEGGSLAVVGGAAVAASISRHSAQTSIYDHVIATRDYHVDPGTHFSDNPNFVDSWPPHCVVGTPGASFHPELDITPIAAVFSKGAYSAAYSGFEGATADNVSLTDWLHDRRVTAVDVVGIATDHCVRATALDAVQQGFDTTILLDLTAGVAQSTVDTALAELRHNDITLVGVPFVA